MRAAVLADSDRAVLRSCHHDGRGADIGPYKVAAVRDLRLERNVVPGRAVEDALDFALIDGFVSVHPVRNLGEIARPHILTIEQHSFSTAGLACYAVLLIAADCRVYAHVVDELRQNGSV